LQRLEHKLDISVFGVRVPRDLVEAGAQVTGLIECAHQVLGRGHERGRQHRPQILKEPLGQRQFTRDDVQRIELIILGLDRLSGRLLFEELLGWVPLGGPLPARETNRPLKLVTAARADRDLFDLERGVLGRLLVDGLEQIGRRHRQDRTGLHHAWRDALPHLLEFLLGQLHRVTVVGKTGNLCSSIQTNWG
jgi:hypothetical protein